MSLYGVFRMWCLDEDDVLATFSNCAYDYHLLDSRLGVRVFMVIEVWY